MFSTFDVDWKTPHLWRKTGPARTAAAPLTGEAEVDVLVVGGGLTGMGAALAAADAGLEAMLLEGNEIGSAASGRNNGLVISHHSKASPSEIEATFGPVIGQRYNAMIAASAGHVFDTMRRFGIDAHQVENGWIQPCHSATAAARGRKVYEEWKALGHAVEWLDRETVTGIVGARYTAGWRVEGSGHINPFALTVGLAAALEGLGVTIAENSRATRIVREGAGWRIFTAGGSVNARQVILATNALTGDIWPELGRAMIPFKVFQASTRPVPEALRQSILVGNPAVSDTRRDIRAYHYDRDFRIVTGGTHSFWHNAERRGLAKIARAVADSFPQLGADPEIENYWEGTFAVVPDRKPRLFRLGDGLIFGGIYSGRGVAASMSLGREMGRLAAGQKGDADMPLPVTAIRTVPSHWMATTIANHIHPWHRLRDRTDK
ncbi:FAD-dependent oxidoreductase [Acuticoccus sediminis]|uniref:FAD-dependent oxidoreductase n=1 Tax=Acuticoccus sediminis TaxID=2184697 RepID=A0A8B2NVB3_9HYPH|nr:FAD-dependent oxidoreductase [Acuticoccus sediminis]RAI01673.1 FAD-dependent oxidoreductase [Acuticoccus sediminis]